MTIIIMQCECGENVVLVMDTEKKKFMGYCPNCRSLFDMNKANLGDVEVAEMLQNARRLEDQKTGPEETLFYLRCTDAQLTFSTKCY